MIVGIDTGGTNVDGVLVDDGVVSATQVPGDRPNPNEEVLDELVDSSEDIERVVVVTTLVLNAAVQERLPHCTNVIVPGPGLNPERAFHGKQNHVARGCIDTRGRVVEAVAYDEDPAEEVVAVTAKFGTRNPDPEQRLGQAIDRPPERMAFGHASGPGLSFPERAATTVANARARPTFAAFADSVSEALGATGIDAPTYYLKGDGALLTDSAMRSTPAHALRAGAAASALGLVALTGIEDGICVDVGGTTTDVIRVADGFPGFQTATAGALKTGYESVRATSLPVGGDSRVLPEGLVPRREGNAAAFGGSAPTLTDALHISDSVGGEVGNERAARESFDGFENPEQVARDAVESYVDQVSEAVETVATGQDHLLAGGVLAPSLADRIATNAPSVGEVSVPVHAAFAGAVGCAVARVSVQTRVRADSARGTKTVAAVGTRVEDIQQGRQFAEEEIEEMAIEHARVAAREAGAESEEPPPVDVLDSRRFNVVEDASVTGQVVHATAQVRPGLRTFLEGEP